MYGSHDMERRQTGRNLVDGPAPVSLHWGGQGLGGSLCDVSRGGTRIRFPAPASPAVESALRAGHPCRLEIEGIGALTALPRWLAAGDAAGFVIGASLAEPERVSAPLAHDRPEVTPDAAMVSWIRFFTRQALLAHLGGQRDDARRARRRALQLAGSVIERGLQRVVVCGGDRALIEDEPGGAQRLEAAADLARLGAWTGTPNAVVAAGMLRVVAHLSHRTGRDFDEALQDYQMLACVAEAPVLRWSAAAIAAVAERRVRQRRAAAGRVLDGRDFRGLVEPAEGFPTPSFVGVLSAALAVFAGGGASARRRSRSRASV